MLNLNKSNDTPLSVVIPAYNEEERIDNSLNTIIRYMENRGYRYEIIVVNDGSTDKTVDIVKNFSVRNKNINLILNEKNMGKGYSVKKGILESNGEYILFSDSDLSTPIEEIEKLIRYLQEDYDIAIGSRALPNSDVQIHQSFHRELMGKIFNLITRILTLMDIKDTQCGFKCFKKDAAKNIFRRQIINGFSFDVEILYIAKKLGYKIREVPVVWLNSNSTRVNLIKDSIRMFIDLLRIRINDYMGRYS